MADIKNAQDFLDALDPSNSLGYPTYYLCADGGILSWEAATEMKDRILEAINARGDQANEDKQWDVIAWDINYENTTLVCSHNNTRIASAYADEEPEQTHDQWLEEIQEDEMYRDIEILADEDFKALGVGKDGKAHFIYQKGEMGFHFHNLCEVSGGFHGRGGVYDWYADTLRDLGYVLEDTENPNGNYDKLVKAGEYELLLNDARGIYIPRDFEETSGDLVVPYEGWEEDREILKDPDNEFYWDTWNDVLDKAVIKSRTDGKLWRIYQNGDLWAYEDGKPIHPMLSGED